MNLCLKKLIHMALLLLLFEDVDTIERRKRSRSVSDIWAIEVSGGETVARIVSGHLGFEFLTQMGSLKDSYLVKSVSGRRHRRSLKENDWKSIKNHYYKISSLRQQKVVSRKKRDYIEDPLYKEQWYLENTGQTYTRCFEYKDGSESLDINVVPVWERNITGRGILISILDDGVEYTHPDLKKNYFANASFDYNNYDKSPIPRYNRENINKHGTRCAGEIVGEKGNGVCGVGVAYNAKVSGIRMLDGDVSDAIEGSSLSHAQHQVDIYSISWGPDDDGRTFDGPARYANQAFREGIKLGRTGLGSIFVWATGNGGQYDFCSCDGYINSIFTVAIGAVDNCGRRPWYSEACPGTIAVTYSSGDRSGKYDKQISTTDIRHKCTKEHTGTSAAAPIASGIFALTLEANPKLSWRDLQHLIVTTSLKIHPNDTEWHQNGAGHYFNIKYGFGALDANGLVTMAQNPNWKTVKPQRIFMTYQEKVTLKSIGYDQTTIHSSMSMPHCPKNNKHCINTLEHVHVIVTIGLNPSRRRKGHRGDLSIWLTSPSGTESEILRRRRRDVYKDNNGFDEWEFLTLFHWGENPQGLWKLSVTDHSGEKWYLKRALKWKLKFYGTYEL